MGKHILGHGDYCLATKYHDGYPGDQWCVGFFDCMTPSLRFLVTDNNGEQFRASGFRRCERISRERGAYIIGHKSEIATSSASLWGWKRRKLDEA